MSFIPVYKVVGSPGGVVGIVVITSAYRTEDPGFESRQGVRFLGIYSAVAVLLS
jgi:hypothetical protein